MAVTIDVLISEEDIAKRTKEIGEMITKDYQGEVVTVICVLKGGVMFMSDLSKQINLDVKMDFMAVSSYGNETSSSGVVKIVKDLDDSIEGQNVIIVEDIIDSGRTLNYLVNILNERNPKSIKIVTLLDKPERRVVDVAVDYVGFEIPDHFVVGFGLDYMQKYRNLPYIGIISNLDE